MAELPTRLRLRAAVESGHPLLFAPVVAVVWLLLCRLPLLVALGLPLVDVAVGAGVDAVAPSTALVVLEEWPNGKNPDGTRDTSATRATALAAARRQLKDVVDAVHAARSDAVIAVDIVFDEAVVDDGVDAALKNALVNAGAVVGDSAAAAYAGVDHAAVAVSFDRDGVTRVYGHGGGVVDDSLAAAVAARTGAAIPRAPFYLPLSARSPDVPDRFTTVTARALLAGSPILQALGPRPVVVVGVGGARGRALDPRRVLTPEGPEVVAGLEVHAAAIDRVRAGAVVAKAGVVVEVVAGVVVACVVGAVVARLRRRRAVVVVVVIAAGLLLLPAVVVVARVASVLLSPLPLMTLPVVVVAGAAAAGALARRLRWRATFAAQLSGVPAPFVHAVQAGVVEGAPAVRLQRLLAAYEDLMGWAVIALLATKPLPKKGNGVRDLWHTQHTLSSTLATLSLLAPTLSQRVQEESELSSHPALQALLRARVPVKLQLDGDESSVDLSTASSREKHKNWFVVLRNALAHDGAAGVPDDAAADVVVVLQEALARLLGAPELRALFVDARFDAAALTLTQGETTSTTAPWLRKKDGVLFRYRGLADRKDFPKEGKQARRLVVFVGVTGDDALPARVTVPLTEILDAVPEPLRIDALENA